MMLYQNMIYISPDDALRQAIWSEQCCGRTPEHIASWLNDGFGDYVNELPDILREIEQRIGQKRYPVEVCITPEGIRPDNIAGWYDMEGVYDCESRCVMPFSHLHVRSGGNVDMCVDFDDFSAGNVRERDVMEIFNGPEAEKFRRKFLENPPPICRRCPWRCNRNPGLDLIVYSARDAKVDRHID
jgi:MoaA/NifB/PqqE/SkfB family radical SAM enzyme